MVEPLKQEDRGLCACRRRAVVQLGNRGLCRPCARALAIQLITHAGSPEPADNRVLVAQES